MDEKTRFLNYELWALTISASFQRANVYKAGNEKYVENKKASFKNYLRSLIEKIAEIYHKQTISEEQHIANINKIVLETSKCEFRDILSHSGLHFGIAQKLLNLYLKYQWCAGFLRNSPPHFPVDRQIQEKLKLKKIVSWTKEKELNEKSYMDIIECARTRAKESNLSLADFELREFNNR